MSNKNKDLKPLKGVWLITRYPLFIILSYFDEYIQHIVNSSNASHSTTSELGGGYVPNLCYSSTLAQSPLSTLETETRELVFEAIGGDV